MTTLNASANGLGNATGNVETLVGADGTVYTFRCGATALTRHNLPMLIATRNRFGADANGNMPGDVAYRYPAEFEYAPGDDYDTLDRKCSVARTALGDGCLYLRLNGHRGDAKKVEGGTTTARTPRSNKAAAPAPMLAFSLPGINVNLPAPVAYWPGLVDALATLRRDADSAANRCQDDASLAILKSEWVSLSQALTDLGRARGTVDGYEAIIRILDGPVAEFGPPKLKAVQVTYLHRETANAHTPAGNPIESLIAGAQSNAKAAILRSAAILFEALAMGKTVASFDPASAPKPADETPAPATEAPSMPATAPETAESNDPAPDPENGATATVDAFLDTVLPDAPDPTAIPNKSKSKSKR